MEAENLYDLQIITEAWWSNQMKDFEKNLKNLWNQPLLYT